MGRNASRVDAMHARRSITITSTVRHGGLSTSTKGTCGRVGQNDGDQRLAALEFPYGPILSRVRCIALLGASAEYMGSKRNVNHAKAVPVNAAEPPDEKVMSLAEGANVLLAGVWVVIGHESLKGGRIRWM